MANRIYGCDQIRGNTPVKISDHFRSEAKACGQIVSNSV